MSFLSNFGGKIIFMSSVNFWHQQEALVTWPLSASGLLGLSVFKLSRFYCIIINNILISNGKLPGKGPFPGGINKVPRTLPSLTSTLFTLSLIYHFCIVVLVSGCKLFFVKLLTNPLSGARCPSKQFSWMVYGLVTSFFISRNPFLWPGACVILHRNPICSMPVYEPPWELSQELSTFPLQI